MQPLIMTPAPGERLMRFVGDQISFRLEPAPGHSLPDGWQGRLRTNLGRGARLRREIIEAYGRTQHLVHVSWRDIPMQPLDGGWSLSLSLTEVGYFRAKAYALDPKGWQHWPEGRDFGLSVQPDAHRTANILYCAFPRLFGDTRKLRSNQDDALDARLAALDKGGYTVIPPSGKLRDLIQALPHVIDTLGCRIVHLLPVNPTPTTYARFGRFGSPYACQDLLAIDPALVAFDKRTTGVDQFRELAYAVHARGARLFLDIVINHTGWGATLQENHPEWFIRDEHGAFVSPGAWGVTWEDLVELSQDNPALWEYLGDVFLEWCRRGVDGFRCDAGYKIPVEAWRYITARVLREFPDTIFLLEGLGGSWQATEDLLTEGGMQWAYSELFQNYSSEQISEYLDYALRQSRRVGVYVHYSETHDNDRLAARGRDWSLLRNRLCALTSVNGAFGFTCGVEWLAAEKIRVHGSTGLAWNNPDNIIPELARLNHLLANHPCFFDNATLVRHSRPGDDVYALSRVSEEGVDKVLVLVNMDPLNARTFTLEAKIHEELGRPTVDLLGQPAPVLRARKEGRVEFTLGAGGCCCLARHEAPAGLSGDRYREVRARSAWALTAISHRIHVRDISPFDWARMAGLVDADPAGFLTAVSHLDADRVKEDVLDALNESLNRAYFPPVVTWSVRDRSRVTLVPRDHWLLIEDDSPFRAVLQGAAGTIPRHLGSIRAGGHHVAVLPPGLDAGDSTLSLERYAPEDPRVSAALRFIPPDPRGPASALPSGDSVVLLTNGIGGMARVRIDPGRIGSKYDCVLGANLNPNVPVDRHVFVKRARLWVNADGFITPLDMTNLAGFSPGPPAEWRFTASAGDERVVEVRLTMGMLDGFNTTLLRLERPALPVPIGRELAPDCRVSLTVRMDIEDRNFHAQTEGNGGADYHFNTHTRTLEDRAGFEFRPSEDRRLRVYSNRGQYHPQTEWCRGIPHPVEGTRGQVDHGDAFSPGWFELPIEKGESLSLVITAEPADPEPEIVAGFRERGMELNDQALQQAAANLDDTFGRRLALAIRAFVVRRGSGKTVIAGYPWFLDWGRDSLICARGLLTAGMIEETKELVEVFGRFERQGTLPNTIHGEDASNRETSDAPLWLGMACEDLAVELGPTRSESFYSTPIDAAGRSLASILRSIAEGYRTGTSNGIRMDPESALIWSPPHFTWMDTNFPAGTPRQGYPIEIQALWVRLLRQVAELSEGADAAQWTGLATRATQSLTDLYWLEAEGYLSDLLIARPGQPAREAVKDTALRSNCLFAVSLGIVSGARARRCVQSALRHLVVPGALRSLAPLPVSPPLEIRGNQGQLLGDPVHPYRGRYEGDEDTSRKPAYHNGTAWTWTFPVFCEALVRAWDFDADAVSAARCYLRGMEALLDEGCLGQIPEIVDGDAPHAQRGCDAQAWGATEALRVWRLLSRRP